ncbi:MAG: B12-binding domain-containing radical SAM protein [Magnetococcales bacterium]|nr:B12-binding domain-containing radical SAM protein [Magnetococcales bacterium]
MNEKIILINPKMFNGAYRFFPIGIGSIAASLFKHGIDHEFHDQHIDWQSDEDLITQIRPHGVPRMFGLTGLLTSFQSVKNLAIALKMAFPESKIVLGGKIVVVRPDILFHNMPVDYIIRGEGEEAIIALWKALHGEGELETIKGLTYRTADGVIHDHGETDPVRDLDSYIIPYHRFDMEKYITSCNIQSPNVPSINMISSRGCPFSCTFCNFSLGDRVPVRFYSNLADSLDYLIQNFGLQHVTFNDDMFTVNRNHMRRVCDIIKERKLSFSISTRLDFLNEASIALLDESGCKYLCIGIESPSPTVAKVIDKRLNLEKFQANITALKQSRIVVNYGFIFGYLGETEQTIAETRDFVLRNGILYSAFFANAFPRTLLYEMIQDRIGDEEAYLQKLYSVDLTKDYLVNMTDIPRPRLYQLRDEIIVDSVLNLMDKRIALFSPILRAGGLVYLAFMRRYGLRFAWIKRLFEFINMSIVKPATKGG